MGTLTLAYLHKTGVYRIGVYMGKYYFNIITLYFMSSLEIESRAFAF